MSPVGVLGRASAKARSVTILAALCAANVVLGAAVAHGQVRLALVAVVALAAVAALGVAVAHPSWLVYAAFVLATIAGPLDVPLAGGGGKIFPTDLLLGLAVAGHVIRRLLDPTAREQRVPWPAALTWPLALFAVAILIGIRHGHDRWGLSYLSQPIRMVAYAAIATALVGISARAMYRAVVVIFYVDVIWQLPQGLYYLATGGSQTASVGLSTGGTRGLALSTAMYLVGALVLALLNLEFDDERHRLLHIAIAALAASEIVIAFGRTNFGALAVVVPLLLLGLRRLRRTALAWLPLAIPVVAMVVAIALQVRPSLASTFADRLTGQVGRDPSLIQRQRKYDATLQGLSGRPFFGFGFGRPVQFTSIDRSVQTISGDPENSYVWILAGGGFFALVSLIVLIVTFFADAFRRMIRATGEERALVIFAMSLAFTCLFNALTGPILSDATFMMTIWLAMLLPSLAARESAAEIASDRPRRAKAGSPLYARR
jgi:O-antigen ligase